MRNIELDMLNAIEQRKDWRSANTRVAVVNFSHAHDPIDRINVYLHDNLIATLEPNYITINNCGWFSPTTKSRLNVLLWKYAACGISQRKGEWYINKKVITLDGIAECSEIGKMIGNVPYKLPRINRHS